MKKQVKKINNKKAKLSTLRKVGIATSIILFIGFAILSIGLGIYCRKMQDYCDSLDGRDPMGLKGSTYFIGQLLFAPLVGVVALLNLGTIRNYLHENDIEGYVIFRGIFLQGVIPGIILGMLSYKKDRTADGKDYSLFDWGGDSNDHSGPHMTDMGIIIEY